MRRQDKKLVIENYEIYQYYKERLINIALSQFEWHGLPKTCDRLFFERTLLLSGKAAMLKPRGLDDLVSVDFLQVGNFDIYGYPTDIIGIGYNARNIETDDWLILFDNMTKTTLMNKIDLYARLLWECHNTFRSNLQQQVTPYIIATNRNSQLTKENFMLRVQGFQPVVVVKDGEDIKDSITAFQTGVEFRGNEMLQCLKTIWAEALSMLGISAETTKKERLISDEITINRQEDLISLNSRLLNRVDFCNKANERWGLDLSVNLSSNMNTELYGDYSMMMLQNSGADENESNNSNKEDVKNG